MPDDRVVEQVLELVEAIPAGQAATYGDIAGVVGIGPRQVGKIMSQIGAAVPWWRVVNAKGSLPPALLATAKVHWAEERTPMTETGCQLARCRVEEDWFGGSTNFRCP